MIYHLSVKTKGHKETKVSNNVTLLRRTINKILSETSITFTENLMLSERQLQHKLKNLPYNDFIIFKVEKSIIKIDKLKNPE